LGHPRNKCSPNCDSCEFDLSWPINERVNWPSLGQIEHNQRVNRTSYCGHQKLLVPRPLRQPDFGIFPTDQQMQRDQEIENSKQKAENRIQDHGAHMCR